MGRGRSKGGSGAAKQIATKAAFIENMNEAQIDKEIASAERQLERERRTMQKNDITATAEAVAGREYFPLGVGGDGWTQSRLRQRERTLERDAKMAKAYTDARNRAESVEKRLESLHKAKETVKGTGKTQKQIAEERARQAVAETKNTLKWKTTQKAKMSSTGYTPQIIKAGDYEIHGSSGLYSVYENGKLLGRVNKLSTAKAIAERRKKR